ncbi:hypothetical protein CBL_20698, partial [Carabus blaptoides fortunei]
EGAHRQLPPPRNTQRPRGRPSAASRGYQDKRVYRFKTEKSHATEQDLSTELHKELLPGFKTGQSAAERLAAYNVSRVKTITVSPRAIGFASFNFFFCLHEYNNVPVNGSIYQIYRVGLAALECKISIANRNITGIQDSLKDYAPINRNNDYIVATKGISASRSDYIYSTELSAFIGLLYMAGIKKGKHLNTKELWANDGTAPDYFIATMSRTRFHLLLQAIRFDDLKTRAERSQVDKLAPKRSLFDRFGQSCSAHYTPGEYVTIDEMLVAFRGRCSFRQYIANKPAKYGIKIYALADSRTFYTHNLEIYTGKQTNGPYSIPNDANSVVKRLIKTIDKSGRNVTLDNYFASVQTANDLFDNHKLTLVGTIRKNKPQIPPRLLEIKDRAELSSMFAFGIQPNHCMLASFVPKKHKNVLMISTLHDNDSIDPESTENKPEIISFYNLTKGGVDVVDKLTSEYS